MRAIDKNVITAAQPNAHLLLDTGFDARLHSAGNSETWELPLKGQKDWLGRTCHQYLTVTT